MLVLSRKVGESILISDNIKINIVSISGDKVTIAIDAPKEINIMRDELLETIEANKDANTIKSPNYLKIKKLYKSPKVFPANTDNIFKAIKL